VHIHAFECLLQFYLTKSSVGFKIGSNFVRVHNPASITAVMSPSNCILDQPMQPFSNGIATFSQAIFTGHIGECTMQFQVQFDESTNPAASSQNGPTTTIQVISSSMIIKRPLQNGPLVAGSPYTFAGMMLM